MEHPLKHEHLLVQARVKKPIVDTEIAKKWISDLVEKVDMVIAAGPIASYVESENNMGITCCVCIQTSHMSLHIWDQIDPPLVQFDLYSCSTIDLDIVWKHLLVMEPDIIEYKFLDRQNGFETISEGTKMFGINGVGPDKVPFNQVVS
jgi:S-adenosylmethionine/arginine decarboxylase-like enzyme